MTGGQMAPTTLIDQVTNTSPYGRSLANTGNPIRVSEMLSTLDGAVYIARVAVNNPGNMAKAKAAIKTAFEHQLKGDGFAMVEVLSTCPTNWKLTPLKANKWLEDNMMKVFPLGVYKEVK
jgi:2-oxoglutarate ferredoxin oxidoreductase subunit beta